MGQDGTDGVTYEFCNGNVYLGHNWDTGHDRSQLRLTCRNTTDDLSHRIDIDDWTHETDHHTDSDGSGPHNQGGDPPMKYNIQAEVHIKAETDIALIPENFDLAPGIDEIELVTDEEHDILGDGSQTLLVSGTTTTRDHDVTSKLLTRRTICEHTESWASNVTILPFPPTPINPDPDPNPIELDIGTSGWGLEVGGVIKQ